VGQINSLIKEKVLKSEIGNEENKLDILMRKYEVKYGE
jgi:hypothetical protein